MFDWHESFLRGPVLTLVVGGGVRFGVGHLQFVRAANNRVGHVKNVVSKACVRLGEHQVR